MSAVIADSVTTAHVTDRTTAGRIRLLAVVMVLAAITSAVLVLFWDGPEESNGLYTYAELAPDRDQWWATATAVGLLVAITVPAQAVLTLSLVRARGGAVATVGGVLMWLGAAAQAVGLAGWAAAYYAPTDPELAESAGRAVFEAANGDEVHLYGLVPIGMGLVVLGTICQAVGLFRSREVPRWVPVLALSVVTIFLVPGFGPASLISGVPLVATAAAIGVFATRRASGS